MSLGGKVIISGLTYYSELENGKNSWGLQNVSVKELSDSIIEIRGIGINDEQIDLLITTKEASGINFKIKTAYKRNGY